MAGSEPVITAALVFGPEEAYLAVRSERLKRGANGEVYIATLLHTSDSGRTWTTVPLVRALLSAVRGSFGYPTWPPESIDSIEVDGGLLSIQHRDEWVPFEPGGESLWKSTRSTGGDWTPSRVRYLDYEGDDHPGSAALLELEVPDWLRGAAQSVLQEFQNRLPELWDDSERP